MMLSIAAMFRRSFGGAGITGSLFLIIVGLGRCQEGLETGKPVGFQDDDDFDVGLGSAVRLGAFGFFGDNNAENGPGIFNANNLNQQQGIFNGQLPQHLVQQQGIFNGQLSINQDDQHLPLNLNQQQGIFNGQFAIPPNNQQLPQNLNQQQGIFNGQIVPSQVQQQLLQPQQIPVFLPGSKQVGFFAQFPYVQVRPMTVGVSQLGPVLFPLAARLPPVPTQPPQPVQVTFVKAQQPPPQQPPVHQIIVPAQQQVPVVFPQNIVLPLPQQINYGNPFFGSDFAGDGAINFNRIRSAKDGKAKRTSHFKPIINPYNATKNNVDPLPALLDGGDKNQTTVDASGKNATTETQAAAASSVVANLTQDEVIVNFPGISTENSFAAYHTNLDNVLGILNGNQEGFYENHWAYAGGDGGDLKNTIDTSNANADYYQSLYADAVDQSRAEATPIKYMYFQGKIDFNEDGVQINTDQVKKPGEKSRKAYYHEEYDKLMRKYNKHHNYKRSLHHQKNKKAGATHIRYTRTMVKND